MEADRGYLVNKARKGMDLITNIAGKVCYASVNGQDEGTRLVNSGRL